MDQLRPDNFIAGIKAMHDRERKKIRADVLLDLIMRAPDQTNYDEVKLNEIHAAIVIIRKQGVETAAELVNVKSSNAGLLDENKTLMI